MCEPPITMCVCEPPIRVGLRAPITWGVHEFSMIAGIAGGTQSHGMYAFTSNGGGRQRGNSSGHPYFFLIMALWFL